MVERDPAWDLSVGDHHHLVRLRLPSRSSARARRPRRRPAQRSRPPRRRPARRRLDADHRLRRPARRSGPHPRRARRRQADHPDRRWYGHPDPQADRQRAAALHPLAAARRQVRRRQRGRPVRHEPRQLPLPLAEGPPRARQPAVSRTVQPAPALHLRRGDAHAWAPAPPSRRVRAPLPAQRPVPGIDRARVVRGRHRQPHLRQACARWHGHPRDVVARRVWLPARHRRRRVAMAPGCR